MAKNTPSFPDHNQNFWQLASIQGASQSVLALLLGGVLTQLYGSLVALASICVGNLLLWLIGLGVISMSAKKRQNIIQTVGDYLGKSGSFLMILILTSAFIFWYTIELQVTVETLAPILPTGIQLGVVGFLMGVFVAILSLGGIRLIKWFCVYSFPFILIFIFYILVFYSTFDFDGEWGISIPAVTTVIAMLVPGVVNLSTFFRHSRSRADSILGLTLTVLSFVLFEVISVFVVVTSPSEIFGKYINESVPVLYILFSVLFVLLIFICVNLVNIYLASAGFEALFPAVPSRYGCFFIGLLGSLFYFFIKDAVWTVVSEQIVDDFIVNLGVVLMISFFVKMLVKHRPRRWEQLINCACWLIGCITTLIFQQLYPESSNKILLAGIWATLLSFVVIIFVEELLHSYRKIKSVAGFWG